MCRASRAQERRQHLIDVARRLFSERGFHATGVAQIATASGIKVGQIYRDFQSKEDIVAAIVEIDLAAFLDEDALSDAIEAGDRTAVRNWIGRLMPVDEPIESCRMMAEIMAEAARNARIADIHRAIDRHIRGLAVQALTALAPDPDQAAERARLAELIIAMSLGLADRRIVAPEVDASGLVALMNRIVDDQIAAMDKVTA
jgi:AcrR family transcriptional regulator